MILALHQLTCTSFIGPRHGLLRAGKEKFQTLARDRARWSRLASDLLRVEIDPLFILNFIGDCRKLGKPYTTSPSMFLFVKPGLLWKSVWMPDSANRSVSPISASHKFKIFCLGAVSNRYRSHSRVLVGILFILCLFTRVSSERCICHSNTGCARARIASLSVAKGDGAVLPREWNPCDCLFVIGPRLAQGSLPTRCSASSGISQRLTHLHDSQGSTQPELMSDAVIVQVAAETGRTAGQVLLRWATQQGISVIPKSLTYAPLCFSSCHF
jgi:hypothetical protein